MVDLVESLPIPEPDPPAQQHVPVCTAAIDLVIHFEIGSPAYYLQRLQRPIWPGAASGVTLGIGYDLGHQIPTIIRQDWRRHPHVDELPSASGVTGERAKPLAQAMRHIHTPLAMASETFAESTVPRYWQMTRRAFPGVDELSPCARGALLSVVYNRGSAMAGAKRIEMRTIRDRCVPMRDQACIAEQIRAMSRLWRGTSIDAGMTRRREAEADLALQ